MGRLPEVLFRTEGAEGMFLWLFGRGIHFQARGIVAQGIGPRGKLGQPSYQSVFHPWIQGTLEWAGKVTPPGAEAGREREREDRFGLEAADPGPKPSRREGSRKGLEAQSWKKVLL